MENVSNVLAGIALVCSLVSLVVAVVAYRRAGGLSDLQALRLEQRRALDDLATRLKRGLNDTMTRVNRARQHLAALTKDAAQGARRSLTEVGRELSEIEREAERALERVKNGAVTETRQVQEALARRIHHIEATVQVLRARAEIQAAERLADLGEFARAESLLEDAVVRVREAQGRVREELGDESKFTPVIEALHDAILTIRERAQDHKREIDSVLSTSEELVASLQRT